MEAEIRRLGEQIEKLWDSNSERKGEISEFRTDLAELRTGVPAVASNIGRYASGIMTVKIGSSRKLYLGLASSGFTYNVMFRRSWQ